MGTKNILYHVFSVVRLFLYPFALLYGAIVWIRNRLYDSGFFSSIEFSHPVIAIGNLSTGGTGKTPHVEYLVRLLQYRYRVATMSRGYKRHTQGFLLADAQSNALRLGDEPMQYHLKFPELVVSVAEDRMTGIPLLLQQRPDVEVVLLDDAYQHRSVKAGLNVLITDISRPFYEDHILPFGALRESRQAADRAHIIIVSKCPGDLSREQAQAMEQRIRPKEAQHLFFTTLRYDQPYDFFTREPVVLAQCPVLLVCGIARPAPLLGYLQSIASQVHPLTYADHHYFVSQDLEDIKTTYDNWKLPGKIIVTTEKDAARLYLHLGKLKEWGIAIAVIPVTVEVLFGHGHQLDALVSAYVERVILENNPEGGQVF